MPKGIYERATPEERFWVKVDKNGSVFNGHRCWLWQGTKESKGYGQLRVVGQKIAAHRFSYETLIGPIPEGLTLDHLCRTRACVNPAHLEPVSNKVNILRGIGLAATEARRTHCPQGHAYNLFNTLYERKGSRHCIICMRVRSHLWKKAKKERRLQWQPERGTNHRSA